MSYARAFIMLLVPAVAFAGATASNFKPEHRKGANYWNAQSAIDGKLETCWMVTGESPNRGEWIELDLPKSTVDKVAMVVGWAESDSTFSDYARVKKIKVEAFSLNDQQQTSPSGATTAEFQDLKEMQVMDIDDLAVGEDLFGGKLRIHVVDIYDGQDYPNMAISELLVYLTEFDTQLAMLASSDSVGANTIELAQDDNAKTFYATQADGSFTVEASGFGVSSIGIHAGPTSHARPKKVKVTANNRELVHELLDDSKAMQWVMVPTITGYTGGAFGDIQVDILEVYPGTEAAVGIAEIAGKATNYEGF